jgi:NAD(P)-dependent dehydrogenase (short-subunit alcohol dehydrogenase family)
MNFTDRVVLVTGASRGIGRVIAEQFAEHGARVAVHYHRDRAAAEETRALLAGGPHTLVQADLADPDAAGPLIEAVVRDLGRLDVVVNNAGIYEPHPILEVGFETWRDVWERTVATNLLGPAYVTYWAARHMARQGGGRIVNISSRGAFRGEPDMPAYGASKAGLNGLSQSLARALAPHNVFVYVVAPGWVETDMTAATLAGPAGDAIRRDSPLGRVARAEEIAYTVLFLASDGAEFLTGGIIDVNGASYLRS